MINLNIGISPCPNDLFIFYGLLNNKISSHKIKLIFTISDLNTLNIKVLNQKLDVAKISYNNYFHVMNDYIALKVGSAISFNTGPLLLSNQLIDIQNIKNKIIGIPGINTTANFLLSFAIQNNNYRKEILYSYIENYLLQNKINLGVIIHEKKFNYSNKLYKVIDLGVFWTQKTNLPVPLGCVCIKKSIKFDIKKEMHILIKKSILYSISNYDKVIAFICSKFLNLTSNEIKQYINTYVNHSTIYINKYDYEAVCKMFCIKQKNIITKIDYNKIFFDENNSC
ncbi:MAG: hypothetical protein IR527_02680 [Bacteroides sp.]|nr:MAG: hypothetical protein IR527_02680 [Bacteroides sp.]